jgi:hypothetical protein
MTLMALCAWGPVVRRGLLRPCLALASPVPGENHGERENDSA